MGATYQSQRGRDRVVPRTVAVPPPLVRAPFGDDDDGGDDDGGEGGEPGPVSAADLTIVTGTLGLSWRY